MSLPDGLSPAEIVMTRPGPGTSRAAGVAPPRGRPCGPSSDGGLLALPKVVDHMTVGLPDRDRSGSRAGPECRTDVARLLREKLRTKDKHDWWRLAIGSSHVRAAPRGPEADPARWTAHDRAASTTSSPMPGASRPGHR